MKFSIMCNFEGLACWYIRLFALLFIFYAKFYLKRIDPIWLWIYVFWCPTKRYVFKLEQLCFFVHVWKSSSVDPNNKKHFIELKRRFTSSLCFVCFSWWKKDFLSLNCVPLNIFMLLYLSEIFIMLFYIIFFYIHCCKLKCFRNIFGSCEMLSLMVFFFGTYFYRSFIFIRFCLKFKHENILKVTPKRFTNWILGRLSSISFSFTDITCILKLFSFKLLNKISNLLNYLMWKLIFQYVCCQLPSFIDFLNYRMLVSDTDVIF